MYLRLICFLVYIAGLVFSGWALVEAFSIIINTLPHQIEG